MSHNALGRQFLRSGDNEHLVPAHELLKHTEAWDRYSQGESETGIWHRKLQESIDSGLAGDVADHGVKEPLDYDIEADGKLSLMDGHHRLISAVAADPDMKVPMRIDENAFDTYADY